MQSALRSFGFVVAVFAIGATFASRVHAQDTTDPAGGSTGTDAASPPAPPPAPLSNPPAAAPVAPAAPAAPAPAAGDDARSNRPTDGWSLGIGAGWFFPTEILVPNTASVRIMFPGSVTIEPFMNLSLGGSDTVQELDDPIDAADNRSEFTGSNYTAALGTAVRFPIFQRGNLDLQILGSANASYGASSLTGDQTFGTGAPQEVVTEQQTISVSASYGAGIEWFFLQHMALSLDAQNPLATWQRTDSRSVADVEFFDPDTGEVVQDERVSTNRNSAFNAGAIFSPSVRLMFHLYF